MERETFPPGHFYSPIPSLEEIQNDARRIFNRSVRPLPGIDLRKEAQLQLLRDLAPYYRDQPFTERKTEGLRYYFENDAFGYADALFLHCILRHFKPKRLIEVGSGYSSCVTLDTNERFLAWSMDCTFIEPHPHLLHSLLKPGDTNRIHSEPKRLQDCSLDPFFSLQAGDVLFIDSSHVCKTGSDVQLLYTEILPRLAPGVLVHIHDIFFPFEYPQEWLEEGRFWNEAYVLRALLTHNPHLQILLFNHYLALAYPSAFDAFPLAKRNTGGSLWLQTR